jgi:hypothetical protein
MRLTVLVLPGLALLAACTGTITDEEVKRD